MAIWNDTPCIEAKGHRHKNGYVYKRRKGRDLLAHRMAWAEAHGPIPDEMIVRHQCDNPPCVNLAHLLLGTQKENVEDMTRRGRAPSRKGSANPRAKLTEETATYAMARLLAGESQRSVARDFGVSHRCIWNMWRGVTWSNLFSEAR